MNKQYNNIAVFKAKPSQNAKAPQFNVSIEFADGTKWRGGLWERTSKAGTKYLSGNLEADHGGKQSDPRDDPPLSGNDIVDW